MEPEAKYTVVGTVVLILIALIAGAVVWLRSTGGEIDDRSYKIYFERQSLEGLQPRSEVRMRGIRIGSVTGFRISTWRPGAVEVLIRVDGSAPVRESTRAVVERHIVTGIANILLINTKEKSMSVSLILLIVLILLLVGALPSWPHSRNWGYGPSGGLGLVVLVLLVLLLMGRI